MSGAMSLPPSHAGPPLLPTDLRLAEVNLTSVQLTWNLSVLSEFRRIEQYRLELSANGGPFNEVKIWKLSISF